MGLNVTLVTRTPCASHTQLTVKHAPSYGHVDVARALIEQGAELAWADEADEGDAARLLVDPSDVAAADIEAFSRACDDRDDLCDALLDSDSDV